MLERKSVQDAFGGGAEQRVVQDKGRAGAARCAERLYDFSVLERKGYIALDKVEREARKQNGLESKRLRGDEETTRLDAIDFLGFL